MSLEMRQNDKRVKSPLLRLKTSIRGQYGITNLSPLLFDLCASLDGSK